MRHTYAPIASLLLCLTAAGCDAPPPIVPTENGKGGTAITADPSKYPVGPYGYTLGDVIPNLKFVGRTFFDADGKMVDDPVHEISLSDYYQDKSVKAIAILVAAEWCGPCQQEQGELVTTWKKYQADKAGVVFVEALIESSKKASNGRFLPADTDTIARWGARQWSDATNASAPKQYIPFPLVSDPTVELGPYYAQPAFPTQIVVDAKDMTITWQNAGYGKGALAYNVDQVLSGGN